MADVSGARVSVLSPGRQKLLHDYDRIVGQILTRDGHAIGGGVGRTHVTNARRLLVLSGRLAVSSFDPAGYGPHLHTLQRVEAQLPDVLFLLRGELTETTEATHQYLQLAIAWLQQYAATARFLMLALGRLAAPTPVVLEMVALAEKTANQMTTLERELHRFLNWDRLPSIRLEERSRLRTGAVPAGAGQRSDDEMAYDRLSQRA